MMDVSPFWRTLNASDLNYRPLARKLYDKLGKDSTISLDKPTDEAEIRSVGATQALAGDG
jgi:hypothetical protein